MSNTAIAIINKKRDISTVLENFKHLFYGSHSAKYILLTSSSNNEKIDDNHKSFLNIYSIDDIDNVSKANNFIINKAKELFEGDVDFVHILHDDLIIADTFKVKEYETFISEYNLGYYCSPHMSVLNNIYETSSPRLTIVTERHSTSNIHVYAFDSKEYIIINCKKNDELFNEDLKYLYNIEYLYRCNKNKVIPFLNFYFDLDEFLNDICRDNVNFPRTQINHVEYTKEEEALSKTYNVEWVPSSNADEVINYFRKIKGL